MLETLNKSMFSEYVGQQFRLQLDAPHVLEVELVEVSVIGSGSVPRGGKREPFSIVFRGPHDSPSYS